MSGSPFYILGIESSCDETSAAVLKGNTVLSNIIANQHLVHRYFGGVVPELASRAHQQKIILVVEEALRVANITKNELNAVSVTSGPGLMGALLVGVSFAKALSYGLGVPLLAINHMQGHVLAHFIKNVSNDTDKSPEFPFLCMTVSGGHTQIIKVNNYLEMEILGETQDDAAGEAFDKAAKILGLDYPGGPLIDKYASKGNPNRFQFPKVQVPGYDLSFSGLKTAFLYFIRDQQKTDPDFIQKNLEDICASIQFAIINALLEKLKAASKDTGIRQIAIAGGVSANSMLRNEIRKMGTEQGWQVFIPPFEYCTDNAAMIAMAGKFKFEAAEISDLGVVPSPRLGLH